MSINITTRLAKFEELIPSNIPFVEGKLKGNISMQMKGTNGFGYDPIFIPLQKEITFGQMLKSKKIKMDHRYIAFKKLKKRIKI